MIRPVIRIENYLIWPDGRSQKISRISQLLYKMKLKRVAKSKNACYTKLI